MVFGDDPLGAISIVDEGLEAAHSLRDEWLIAFLLMLRGWYSTNAKDYRAALQSFEESLRRFKSLGDKHWATIVSGLISIVHFPVTEQNCRYSKRLHLSTRNKSWLLIHCGTKRAARKEVGQSFPFVHIKNRIC